MRMMKDAGCIGMAILCGSSVLSQQGLLAPCNVFDFSVRWESVSLGSEMDLRVRPALAAVQAASGNLGVWKPGMKHVSLSKSKSILPKTFAGS